MNIKRLWQKSEPIDRSSHRQGLSLVTTLRGERGQRGSILIRDLSHTGFRAETLVRFRKGSAVIVDLPGASEIEATVEWSRREMIGVSFKQPIALSEVLDGDLAA
jgi:hypothetical protein